MPEEMICGIDEAGRGPLAGPVTAAAVILPEDFPIDVLKDSKCLTPRARTRIAALIRQRALDYAVGWCWPDEIDRINIHCATLLCMKRAVKKLRLVPDIILVDGLFCPCIKQNCRAIVRGDRIIPQIQAASILAKTSRDLWMERYARILPEYGFDKHKGYPTLEHRITLKRLGPSPMHRRSFRSSGN